MSNGKEKLLLYIDAMSMGGANRVMANLAEYFCKIGLQTMLVNDVCLNPESEYKLPPDVKRVFLQREKVGKILKNILRVLDLRRLIKKERPDTIISFMGPPNIRMLIASFGLKAKKVVSVRNDPNFEYGTGLKRLVTAVIFKLADGVVFQTKDAAAYFPKSIRKKSKIIFNPVNPKFYDYHWRPGGTEIVVIGRLQSQKNPMNVLRAFESIHKKIPRYTLGFYGEGELKPELEGYARKAGIADKVNFHGRIDNVERVLENAALFVLCSDHEGMPNVLMEAMAVGVPSIATDSPCGGSRALIENDDQGVLIPCRDSEKLAESIMDILFNNTKQMRMSEAAAKRSYDFAPEKVLAEWKRFITEI